MVPDFQTLLKPVLKAALPSQVKTKDVVNKLADEFGLTDEERNELIPSGRAKKFDNRVHWARFHLKEAGLVESQRRGHISITDKGRSYLESAPERITVAELKAQRPSVEKQTDNLGLSSHDSRLDSEMTPSELIGVAHKEIVAALASDLLDRVTKVDPKDFEQLIVNLLSRMGYGYNEKAGHVLGQSGDDGVDGVINLDTLGVDQVYIQAKRYKADSPISSGAIRDFYGALGLKDVTKGIFVTTSSFSPSARSTAEKLGARIVLIDGPQLARLMVSHEVGCRVSEVFKVSVVEESFFE